MEIRKYRKCEDKGGGRSGNWRKRRILRKGGRDERNGEEKNYKDYMNCWNGKEIIDWGRRSKRREGKGYEINEEDIKE